MYSGMVSAQEFSFDCEEPVCTLFVSDEVIDPIEGIVIGIRLHIDGVAQRNLIRHEDPLPGPLSDYYYTIYISYSNYDDAPYISRNSDDDPIELVYSICND